MTDKTLTALPTATSFTAGSLLYAAVSGNSRKLTGTNLGVFLATATLAAGTLTASAPKTLTQTWNDAGVTFRGKENVFTITAAAAGSTVERWLGGAAGTTVLASIDYLGAATFAGLTYSLTSMRADTAFSVGSTGAPQAYLGQFSGTGFLLLNSTSHVGWSSTSSAVAASDVGIYRGGAGILEQRVGTAAQTHRVFNSWTDDSNGSWGTMNFADVANVLTIGTKSNGSGIGVPTKMQFVIEGVNKLDYGVTTAATWSLIGTLQTNSGINVTGDVRVGAANVFYWLGGPRIVSPSDGVLLFRDAAGTAFTALLLGPSGTAYPRLAPTGTAGNLIIQAADGTAGGGLTVNGPTQGLGYSTGAGGTVTQATDRTTTVVLNKVTGQVITTTTSLAAITIVTFTVTNSTVAATDTIILSKVSGDADTSCWVSAVAAGSFAISLRNNDAIAADTTAFTVNFAVIKGVTS